MYISEISIDGYRNCKNKSTIKFNEGLNIIVGENASGKTTIINAIRMILREQEFKYVTEDEFYKSFEEEEEKKNICIDITMKELTPEEKIIFLSWCNTGFDAELHLEIEKNPNLKGYYRKHIWGGKSKASAFEEESFDFIDAIYLPALRNAEEKLKNGKKSRLALLLKHQYENKEKEEELVNAFSKFNESIINNEENKYEELAKAKKDINTAIMDSMGSVFGQSINLQFSELTFSSILQNIKMVFFPHIGNMDEKKFRDIAINSLGYNNLLYIATVFAELEIVNKNNSLFTVLLIEEPEAHLHPQIQSKLIKYLKQMTDNKKNLQIILTTHSSVIASSVSIDSIIHIIGSNAGIESTKISAFGLSNSEKNYLNRWMDITKSTMLFSKGIILVEGICEAMILPALAPIVLNEYNNNHEKKLPVSLEEAGVTVVNINGINFKYFYPLFANLEDCAEDRLPIRCSGITDKDPLPKTIKDENGKDKNTEVFPIESDSIESGNEAAKLCDVIKKTKYSRLFVSPLKTFEYDLAMNNNFSLMAEIIKDNWAKGDEKNNGVKKRCLEIQNKGNKYENNEERMNDAKYILKHIDSNDFGKGIFSQCLLEKIEAGNDINVPEYIQKAIIWACGGNCDEV